ncbi:iron ABC transporter permease [Verrucomicrobiaceae bacterium 5K15]|uniref:Iron ABC transporter permease n=1 Tax=Oceaniferula flava TaxID=2800421 RepID=A0AAE2SC98_9BACT|nr:iron ABC transporter permease [Oceaniferula flavus]MBK1855556.1 iron ABC transporter permease [Oceaniferula flavus]MBM1136862.1 iron ABC transporter permease [Oceaniferula flavus]
MNKTTAYSITAVVVLIFGVFFVYPVAMTLAVAFEAEDGGFTLDYVFGVFNNPIYMEGLWNAFVMGLGSTVLSLAIAFPLALASHRWVFPLKKWLCILILAPLVLPPFVGAVGIKHILGVSGSLNAFLIDLGLMSANAPVDWLGEGRLWGVIIMNALHLYPILYLNISAALSHLDPAMEQAAQNLGCPPWRRLWKITLPLCMPGVFAGAAIVFIWSFTELGVPLVFDYTRVASVQVYDGIKDLNANPMPYALVGIMLIVSASVFAVSKVVLGRSGLGTAPRPKTHASEATLSAKKGWALAAGFMTVFFIACVPHLGVLFLSVSGDWYGTIFPESMTMAHYNEALGHPLVVPSIKNSLIYATGSTLLDVILGTAIAWVVVRSTIRGRVLLDAVMMLPLAVPGLVLAFGYIAITQKGEPLHWLVGPSNNPIFLLIAAYAVRRLPYVVRAAVAGLQQSNITLEEAAKSLGASPARTMRRVAIPLIGANLVAGGILAFAFAMLEVSDSLILAQQAEHYPITKAIYSLLSTLGTGHELASALGVWAMIFLGISIMGAFVIMGKKGGSIFRM